MNIFTITGEIVLKGKDVAEKQLVNLQGTTNTVTNKMEQNFKRLGSIILTAFSVKALTNFARTLAQTSATVHEEVAQFNAVLGDLTDSMMSRIKAVSKETGILETRLRKTSTAVYAMMHSSGMETKTALDNTERFLKFASDASAFYDKSMEEVQSDLQSFMRGITRAGYSIGLYTSELQRNEKAMEKFGVKYDTLNQKQRYTVMLDIIEETYKLAGVTGQANRESEQWLNTTSNLREAWKQFSATLGEPVMNALLPPMRKLTDLLLKWRDRLQTIYTWIDEHQETMEKLREKITLIATSIGLTVVALAGLTIVKNIIPLAKTLVNILTGNWIIILIAGLALITVHIIKLWNTNEQFRDKVTDVWDTVKGKFDTFVEFLIEKWKVLMTWTKPIIENVKGLFYDIGELLQSVWNNVMVPIWNVLVKAIRGAWDFITSNSSLLEDYINSIVDVVRSVIQTLKALFDGDIQGVFDGLINMVANTGTAIYNEFVTTWGLIYSFIKPVIEAIASWFVNALVKLKEFALAIWDTIKEPLETVWNSVVGWFESLWTAIKEVFSSWGVFFEDLWETIKNTFTKLGTSIGFAIGNAVKSGINAVLTLVENTINKAIGFINGAIDVMNKVPLVNIPHVNTLSIPKLAKGGLATDATIAEIGEAGAEAVIPLENKSALSAIADAIAGALTDTFDFSSLGLSFNLSDALSSLWQQIQETSVFKQIAQALGFPVRNEIKKLNKDIEKLSDNAEEQHKSFWEGVKGAFSWLNNVFFKTDKKIKETFTKIHDKFEKIVNYVDAYITPFFDAIAELQDQRSQQEIDALEKELEKIKEIHQAELESAKATYNKELNELYHSLDIGEMSREDYAKAVEKLNTELEQKKQEQLDKEHRLEQEALQKKDDLARKQFEAEKRTSISMVWVNSALAIMKAFSELGPIGGAVATALLLATAGIQTATIAEQQYTPMLAEGGVVDHATHAIVGEDGAEAVVPLERNLGWVNALANALEPTINTQRVDYTPQIQMISEQIDEMKQILANFLPMIANQDIILDGATVARRMAPYLDGEFGQRQRYANRGL